MIFSPNFYLALFAGFQSLGGIGIMPVPCGRYFKENTDNFIEHDKRGQNTHATMRLLGLSFQKSCRFRSRPAGEIYFAPDESKISKSSGPSPVIFFKNRNFESEVIGAQGVASKRFFAFFGHFGAQKKGRFLGFGSLDFMGTLFKLTSEPKDEKIFKKPIDAIFENLYYVS